MTRCRSGSSRTTTSTTPAWPCKEGYTFDPQVGEYFDPSGELVATSADVWSQVIVPEVINDYVARKRSELPNQWNYSLVLGYDYYQYSKEFWMHSWASVMPYHLNTGEEYSWRDHRWSPMDRLRTGSYLWLENKQESSVFLEGKYNRYWNREWHDFSVGFNYVIL